MVEVRFGWDESVDERSELEDEGVVEGDSLAVRDTAKHLVSPVQGLGMTARNSHREDGCGEKRGGEFHTGVKRYFNRLGDLLKTNRPNWKDFLIIRKSLLIFELRRPRTWDGVGRDPGGGAGDDPAVAPQQDFGVLGEDGGVTHLDPPGEGGL